MTYAGLLWILLAALLALAAGKPPLRISLVTAATVWAADLLATLLKSAFDRERPYEVVPAADPLLRLDLSSSMPSGHAAASAAGAVILAYLLGGRWAWAVGLLAVAVAGLVAVVLVRRLQPTSATPPRSAEARPGG